MLQRIVILSVIFGLVTPAVCQVSLTEETSPLPPVATPPPPIVPPITPPLPPTVVPPPVTPPNVVNSTPLFPQPNNPSPAPTEPPITDEYDDTDHTEAVDETRDCYGVVTVRSNYWGRETGGQSVLSGAGSKLGCLQSMVGGKTQGRMYANSREPWKNPPTAGDGSYDDDFEGKLYGLGVITNESNQSVGNKWTQHQWVCQPSAKAPAEFQNPSWIPADPATATYTGDDGRQHFAYNYCENVYKALIDKNCNILPVGSDVELCDTRNVTATILLSPISLVWNASEADKEQPVTVSFPLDPNQSGKAFLWRASSNLPLVVYDPEHTKRIVSGAQLFGNFTFGKRFKNGYEALATLDANADHKLTGAELAPLALWFDGNRDGVSQPEEVASMTEANITSLNTVADPGGKEGDDIISTVGFEYHNGSKLVSGATVDWFVRTVDSVANIIKEGLFTSDAQKPSIKFSSLSHTGGKKVTGTWAWHSLADRSAEGVLKLTELNGEVRGYSMLELEVKGKGKGEKSVVISVPLTGSTRLDKDGRKIVKFMTTGRGIARSEAELILSGDGNSLEGSAGSTIKLQRGSGLKNPVTYRIAARRLS